MKRSANRKNVLLKKMSPLSGYIYQSCLLLVILVMFSVCHSMKDIETQECSLLRGQAPCDLYGLNGSVKNCIFFLHELESSWIYSWGFLQDLMLVYSGQGETQLTGEQDEAPRVCPSCVFLRLPCMDQTRIEKPFLQTHTCVLSTYQQSIESGRKMFKGKFTAPCIDFKSLCFKLQKVYFFYARLFFSIVWGHHRSMLIF